MKKLTLTIIAIIAALTSGVAQEQKRLMFDLFHGQFQDVWVDPSFYDYVIPGYQEILLRNNVEYVPNTSEITSESLKDIDVLLMLSPLARKTQVNITEGEKAAITDYLKGGGSVIILVDEEEGRVNLKEYGVNDITKQFGIELGEDITDVPGNCGAVSIENEIFGGRREIPYSGSRKVYGGIPASLCMEGGYVHGAYVKLEGGGKLYVTGETMVGLLMGFPDGERNVHKRMQTRWWGKDSHLFMEELIMWSLKK